MKTKNDNDRKRVKTNELAEQRNAEGESGKRMDHALGNGGKRRRVPRNLYVPGNRRLPSNRLVRKSPCEAEI